MKNDQRQQGRSSIHVVENGERARPGRCQPAPSPVGTTAWPVTECELGATFEKVVGEGASHCALGGRAPLQLNGYSYDTALTPTKVAAHYLIGKVGTAVLTITKSGGNLAVAWPLGTTLQETTSLSAAFTDVPGSPVSPLPITASGTKFYRFRL